MSGVRLTGAQSPRADWALGAYVDRAVGGQRHPEQAVARHREATFRHADDRRGGAADPDRAADDGGILIEPRGPEDEADDHRWRAHVLFIGSFEWTAERHASASRREEPAADEGQASRGAIGFGCRRPHGRGIREHGLDLHPRRAFAQAAGTRRTSRPSTPSDRSSSEHLARGPGRRGPRRAGRRHS